MGLAANQFGVESSNFTVEFAVTDGSMTITKASMTVTVTGNTDSKTYNGSEQSVEGYELSCDNALYDETKVVFTGDATAARTDVGTTPMGLAEDQFSYDNSNIDVTFAVTDGSMTITKAAVTVTITGNKETKTYNGEEQKTEGYSVSISDPLYTESDFTFSGTAVAKGTDVNTYPMGLAEDQFTNNNTNFDVTFSVTDGELKINKLAVTVTITGHNHTDTYDGEAHSVSGYDFESTSTLYTEDYVTFSGTAAASRTDVGTTNMELAESQFSNTNTNFDVTFSVTDGYQTITPIDEIVVTITGHNNTATYDGEGHSVSGYDVQISNTLYKESDFTFTGTAAASRTDVGQTDMGLSEEQFTNNNSNFAKVTFVVTDGYQKIEPLKVNVTITGHNSTDAYDGEAHSVSGYDFSADSTLYKEEYVTFNGTASAARTDVGTTNMELAESQFTNTNDNFDVTFSVTDGYQTITAINVVVTITEHSDKVDYDGQSHTVTGYDVSISDPLYKEADFTFSGTASVSGTNAGSYDMELKPEDFTNTNSNFANVTFVIVDGQLVIDPIDITVTITEHGDEVDYDGQSHTVTGYDVSISNPLYKEADFTFSGTASVSGTNAGSYDMELKPEDFANTNSNFDNVTFVIVDGQLVIKPIDVTVTIVGAKNTTDYDGEEHKVNGYTATANSNLYDVENDFTFTGTDEAKRTDAGTTNMGLAASQFTNTNPNFKTVTFEVTDGYQTINPIDVTVTIVGNNNTAVYDAKEHTVTGYTATASTPLYKVSGDTVDFTFSGTAEAKRTVEGQTDMGLKAEQFTNTNPNFATVTFQVTDGYQKITPIDEVVVTITGHHNTTDYDGESHSVSGYDVEISNDLYTEADFTFSGSAEAARTDAGTTNMGLAEDQFTNTNTNFAKVTFVVTDGYQTITPINVTVTITGHTSSVDYDGAEHTVTGYDVEISNPLYKEADIVFSGTAEAKRTNVVEGEDTDGKTDMGLAESQFSNKNTNFGTVTFVVTDGYQEIKPIDVTVTITGRNSSVLYDGNEHEVSGYIAESSNTLYKVDGEDKDFTFSGTAEAKRTDAGKTMMGLAADQFANTNPNFKTVTFNVTDGYQEIKPIDVTVTIVCNNNTTDYDGAAHTVTGYTATASTTLYKVEGENKDFTSQSTTLFVVSHL